MAPITTNYLAEKGTSPWFLAVIVTAAPGTPDAAWQPGRHVYVRVRAGLVDVRGADGIFARVTVAQAAARLRRVAGPDGRPCRVARQEHWSEQCGEFHAARLNRRQAAA